MDHKISRGLLGILGIWLTAGFALPFVNVLTMLSSGQLMLFRGYLTALIALLLLRGNIRHVDRYTYLLAAIVPFATLGLFEGIRHWGAGPTIVIITATPIVNLAIGVCLGRYVSRSSIIALALVLTGVILARWDGHFHLKGFCWSILGMVSNGIFYEFFARSKANALQKTFYSFAGMGTAGLVLSSHPSWTALTDPQVILLLLAFAFIGGFLYMMANTLAFENLPTTQASILSQGETPAVILGAFVLLGERLSLLEWIGVGISLYGAWYLSQSLTSPNDPSQS